MPYLNDTRPNNFHLQPRRITRMHSNLAFLPFLEQENIADTPSEMKKMTNKIQWNVTEHIQAPIALRTSRTEDFNEMHQKMVKNIHQK